MANFNYSTYTQQSSQQSKEYKVSFFSLKNDGDEAIVRFDYDSPDEFNLCTVHSVKIGNFYRRVSCLRNPLQPVDDCPFCKVGSQLYTKFYVKLIEYVQDENGKYVPKAKIWERPASFAKTLAGYLNDYGSLKDVLFKVSRVGASGSLKTTYEVRACLSKVYKDEFYPKDFSAFDDYVLDGHAYLVKTAEEMQEFLDTGDFPMRQKQYKSQPQQFAMSQQQSTDTHVVANDVPTRNNTAGFQSTSPQMTQQYAKPQVAPTMPQQQSIQPSTQQSQQPRRYEVPQQQEQEKVDPSQSLRPRRYTF